jgi:peptidoglycan/LPS O-acetylase OafA/YrhL
LYVQDFVAGITGSAHGGFLHTWSLAVEEQFYLIWPPLLVLLLRRGRSILWWALAGTALSWGLLLVTTQARYGTVPSTYALPHTRAGELLLGCALAVWLGRAPAVLGPPLLKRWLAPAAGVGLLMTASVAGKAGMSAWLPIQIPLVALLSAALIAGLVAHEDGVCAQILRRRPLVWLGAVSYGIYLFHLPALILTNRYGPGPWAVNVTLAFVLTLAVAAASYRFLERPILRLKDRIPTKVRGSDSPGRFPTTPLAET